MSSSREKQRTAAIQRFRSAGNENPSEQEIKREMKNPGCLTTERATAGAGGGTTATLRR